MGPGGRGAGGRGITGAAKKKHADVRLDGVLHYGERSLQKGRGYYMMDSPGNDLESIAGQVASGCNLIYFITGNGAHAHCLLCVVGFFFFFFNFKILFLALICSHLSSPLFLVLLLVFWL
jgi:hypothetical protein